MTMVYLFYMLPKVQRSLTHPVQASQYINWVSSPYWQQQTFTNHSPKQKTALRTRISRFIYFCQEIKIWKLHILIIIFNIKKLVC